LIYKLVISKQFSGNIGRDYMEWRQIEEFPRYSVSDSGKVRNDATDRIMAMQVNQRGILYVGLVRSPDLPQRKRSVALLVAEAFMEPHEPPTFNTVIHLDGNFMNCAVDNLMWRPRWFAVKYHRQFKPFDTTPHPAISSRIQDRRTGVIYRNSMDAAMRCGLLDKEIFTCWLNHTPVWPTYQEFIVLED
jgi:hypothetical protein